MLTVEFFLTYSQRDKGDVFAQTLLDYAAAENVNKNCSQGIKEFADSLVFISDYRYENDCIEIEQWH